MCCAASIHKVALGHSAAACADYAATRTDHIPPRRGVKARGSPGSLPSLGPAVETHARNRRSEQVLVAGVRVGWDAESLAPRRVTRAYLGLRVTTWRTLTAAVLSAAASSGEHRRRTTSQGGSVLPERRGEPPTDGDRPRARAPLPHHAKSCSEADVRPRSARASPTTPPEQRRRARPTSGRDGLWGVCKVCENRCGITFAGSLLISENPRG